MSPLRLESDGHAWIGNHSLRAARKGIRARVVGCDTMNVIALSIAADAAAISPASMELRAIDSPSVARPTVSRPNGLRRYRLGGVVWPQSSGVSAEAHGVPNPPAQGPIVQPPGASKLLDVGFRVPESRGCVHERWGS